MVKDPKDVVREIVASVGRREAEALLKKCKVNPSTAEKLAGDRYESDVGFQLALKIYKALESVPGKVSA